jgi:peptide-methionine (S)-S-oxide reductase
VTALGGMRTRSTGATALCRRLVPAGLILLIAFATASGAPSPTAKATFAGGCFWCMEEPFEKLDGVISVTAGFIGGASDNPTHDGAAAGGSGHVESVEILFDPSRVDYRTLVDVFWHNIDPLTADGQFCDRGPQYRTAIFFHDDEQRRIAEESRQRVEEALHAHVVTEIAAATPFHPAEKFHQDFYRKSPAEYHRYRAHSGRDSRLKEIWGSSAGGREAASDADRPKK